MVRLKLWTDRLVLAIVQQSNYVILLTTVTYSANDGETWVDRSEKVNPLIAGTRV